MSKTVKRSELVFKMRTNYARVTEKFALEAAQKSEVWPIKIYVNNQYSKHLKITEHCAMRMHQRLSSEEYRRVIAEAIGVSKTKMFKKLFVGKAKDTNVVIDDITVGFSLVKDRLVVKTVFKRPK